MNNIPQSVGIIMDGNRRWAKEKGLPTLEGHRIGLEKIRDLAAWAQEAGIKEIVLYAFSTENWNRSKEEVEYLMDLFEIFFRKWMHELIEKNMRIRFIGDPSRASEKIQNVIREVEERTKDGMAGILTVAFSYGGRAEILSAVNSLLIQDREVITEAELEGALWSAGLADPDIIIRTGGEKRLSNFLTWQSVYSELFFVDTYWPAFSKEEFITILEEYSARERRRGR